MAIWVLLSGKRKAATRPRQVLTSVERPCRTVATFGLSDNAMAQVFLSSDDGLPVPLPPAELLAQEPADSPVLVDRAKKDATSCRRRS